MQATFRRGLERDWADSIRGSFAPPRLRVQQLAHHFQHEVADPPLDHQRILGEHRSVPLVVHVHSQPQATLDGRPMEAQRIFREFGTSDRSGARDRASSR